jgi:hypothetical protein
LLQGLELDSLLSDLPLFPDDDGTAREEHLDPLGPASERGPSAFWMDAGNTAHPPGVCPRQLNLLRQLPPEQTCDGLYRVFLEGVHPFIPLINVTSFEQSYKRFWNWYDTWNRQDPATGLLDENPSFLPLLLAVLFTGSLARTNTDDMGNYLLDAPTCSPTVLYRMTLTSLTLVAFPQNPGLHSLMSYVLINAMLIREEEALSSCSFVALAIRIAQAMGLHKDPSQFKNLDPVQSEERRRVWNQLMHLDVMTACVSGLPLVAGSEQFSTTKMMSELRDEHIGKRRESASRDNSLEDRYPGYLLAVGRYDASTVMRKILIRQFSPDPLKLVHIKGMADQLEHLRSRTEFRIGRLRAMQTQSNSPGPDSDSSFPSELSTSSSNPSTTALVGWAIDLLKLMVEKAFCVLYQPIISDGDLWPEARSDAIPHYQEYIEIFLRMSTTENYRPFQWLYPQSYQPLHPTAVLLIDLMKQPNSPERERSKKIIQGIFSLVGPEGRITNGSVNTEHGMSQFRPNKGASRAWGRLEKLRSRVWNHLGLIGQVSNSRAVFSETEILSGPVTQYPYEAPSSVVPVGIPDMATINSSTFPEADVLLFDELQKYVTTSPISPLMLTSLAFHKLGSQPISIRRQINLPTHQIPQLLKLMLCYQK